MTHRRVHFIGGVVPFATVVAVTPALALFSGVSVAPMFIIAAVFSLVAVWQRAPWTLVPLAPLLFLVIADLWGLTSCSWTVTPIGHALTTLLSVTVLAGTGLMARSAATLLDDGEKRLVKQALGAGMGIAVTLLMIEAATAYPLTRLVHGVAGSDAAASSLSRGMALTALLLWPTLSVISRRAGIALVVTTIVVVAAIGKHAVLLALLLAIIVYLAVTWRPAAISLLRNGLVALVLAAPLASGVIPDVEAAGKSGLFNSAVHRLVIWQFILDRIDEHPWRGWGMDASRSMPGGEDETQVTLTENGGIQAVHSYTHLPLHPHSGILQAWVELGLPGAIMFAALLWWICGRIAHTQLPPSQAAMRAAALTTGMVIASLSYGIWQSWWHSSLWLTAMLFAVGEPKGGRQCAE